MNFQECQKVSCPKMTEEIHTEEKGGAGGRGGEKESERDGRCMVHVARPSIGDKEIIHHVSERLTNLWPSGRHVRSTLSPI